MAPALSVIVPSYNRRALLADCLRALEKQTLAPEFFEVIVVLDGCTDGSEAVAARLQLSRRTRVLSMAHAGAAAARNAGVEAAEGEYCVFVDDDVMLAEPALAAHLAAHRQSPVPCAVVGKLSTRSSHRGFPRYGDRSWEDMARRQIARSERGQASLHGGNMSLPRALALRFPFDTNVTRLDDVELWGRLKRADIPRIFAAEAAGLHRSPKTITECLQDIFDEGAVTARLWKSEPGREQTGRGPAAARRPRLKTTAARIVSRVQLPGLVARAAGAVPERLPGSELVFRALRANAYLRGVGSALRGQHEWEQFLGRHESAAR